MTLPSFGARDRLDPEAPDRVPLEDQVSLIRAPLFKTESEGRNPFRIASITDFPCCGYLPTPERTIYLNGSVEEARRYVIEPLDVLLTIVGTVGRVALAPDSIEEEWIPATNIAILRLKQHVNREARVLYLYFRSEKGQSTIRRLIHGKTIPLVSKKALGRETIPIFSKEKETAAQKLFFDELVLHEDYRRAHGEIAEKILRFPDA